MELQTTKTAFVIDFGIVKSGRDWYTINDGVMGGLSDSTGILNQNSLLFKGKVSLDNNGGFASIRCPFGKYDLSEYEKLEIYYRSSGFNFALVLETEEAFYLPNYKYILPDTKGEWQVIEFKTKLAHEYQMGRASGKVISEEKLGNIIRIGFINYDKKAGEFELETDSIKFF